MPDVAFTDFKFDHETLYRQLKVVPAETKLICLLRDVPVYMKCNTEIDIFNP